VFIREIRVIRVLNSARVKSFNHFFSDPSPPRCLAAASLIR